MPAIEALGKWRQEDRVLEIILGCVASYMVSSGFPFTAEGTTYPHPEIPHSMCDGVIGLGLGLL